MNIITVSGTIFGSIKDPLHFEKTSLVQGTISQYGNATYLTDEGEKKKGSQFFNFKLFSSAESIKYFADKAVEGAGIVVVGELVEEEYEASSGERKKAKYVNVLRFDFPGSKGSSNKSGSSPAASNSSDDDDPFA